MMRVVAAFVLVAGVVAADKPNKRLEEALKRGREYLKKLQAPDGSFNLMPKAPIYKEGCTALALWALAAAGEPPNSPAFVNGFKYLLSRFGTERYPDFGYTYNAACIIEAVVAFAARANPQLMQKHERINKRLLLAWRALPDDYQFLARKAARWLVDTQLPNGAWTYTSERRDEPPSPKRDPNFVGGDASNTEYAICALYTLARVGVPVPNAVFQKTAEWLMERQCRRGARAKRFPVPLADTTYRTLRKREHRMWQVYEKKGRASALKLLAEQSIPPPPKVTVRARGWTYRGLARHGSLHRPTGSNTAGALAALIGCKIRLEETNWFRKNKKKINKAIRDGFAFLARNLRFSSDPFRRSREYHIHWLFSLQRACRLALLEKLSTKEWLKPLIRQLLRLQRKDGSWYEDRKSTRIPAAVNTCFALLALSRATYPPVILKLPLKQKQKK